mmetsp:Transcript_16361/g.39548  ORF Transcript_16361/g.39548 Transcript_16361/m.39548 type:complete len:205 (+) Transcript_16361:2512-3126(+)
MLPAHAARVARKCSAMPLSSCCSTIFSSAASCDAKSAGFTSASAGSSLSPPLARATSALFFAEIPVKTWFTKSKPKCGSTSAATSCFTKSSSGERGPRRFRISSCCFFTAAAFPGFRTIPSRISHTFATLVFSSFSRCSDAFTGSRNDALSFFESAPSSFSPSSISNESPPERDWHSLRKLSRNDFLALRLVLNISVPGASREE